VEIDSCASFKEMLIFFDPQKVILGNRRLNDAVGGYMAFSIISDELGEYHTEKQRLI
jgi:hypothetical protein